MRHVLRDVFEVCSAKLEDLHPSPVFRIDPRNDHVDCGHPPGESRAEPARHRTTPLITSDSRTMLPLAMALLFERSYLTLSGRA